ncbi:MAG: cupin domain-containing protein [Deltaproteobacteria bacterium]|nr:cupin domain-containing protein [Deltaproteobacteria bacterium]
MARKGKKKKDPADSYGDFLADIARFARGERERAFFEGIEDGSREEEIPVNVGERLRIAREKKGLNLQDISQRTGFDIELLSGIEEGKIAPPLGTIIRLAKALEMKMGYFIGGDGEKTYTIVRRKDRKIVSRYDAKRARYYGYEYESLAPQKKNRHMEPFLVTLHPSKANAERSTHDGQEFIFVLQGRVEVRLQKDVHVLEPGEAIYYDSTLPHLVKCHGDDIAKILAVLYAEK